MSELARLTTEQQNLRSQNLDRLSSEELVTLINQEDALVISAVATQTPQIAAAIDMVAERLAGMGRLIYIGAGTSGRLGVLDAAECPPTFNTDPQRVIGIVAGGIKALTQAVEGAEDQADQGVADLQGHHVTAHDVVMGIAASGRTPYVLAALRYAREVGAATIGLTCNPDSPFVGLADLVICPVVGPEVLSGSTRMKSGTATKLVLNTVTTGAMVKLGKTYGNLMVDLRATNYKLQQRAWRIVQQVTGLDPHAAQELLARAGHDVKTAIVMHGVHCSEPEARQRLATHKGQLRAALEGSAG